MEQWEYAVIRTAGIMEALELEQLLNRMGMDNWELCADINTGLIFKRRRMN